MVYSVGQLVKPVQGVEVWQEVGSLPAFNSNKKVFVTIYHNARHHKVMWRRSTARCNPQVRQV